MEIKIQNRAAFMAVWGALNEFVDNQVEVDDESEWPADVQAEVREARRIIEQMDAVMARAAG